MFGGGAKKADKPKAERGSEDVATPTSPKVAPKPDKRERLGSKGGGGGGLFDEEDADEDIFSFQPTVKNKKCVFSHTPF